MIAMTLRKETDEALLVHIRDHNEGALRELLNRYHPRLTEFATTILKRRDLAEEAVLNVYHNLWKRRETLAIKGKLKSYLFAAVGNQALTLLKAHMRHAATWLEDVPPAQLVARSHPKKELIFKELRAEIDELILRLPPQRQLIFRMNRLEGIPYAEIAQALAVSPRTVQNHMIHAMRQLTPHIEELQKKLKLEKTL